MNDHNMYFVDHELEEAKLTRENGDIIELGYAYQTYEFTKDRLIESYESTNPDEDIIMKLYKYEILSENKIFIKGIQEESVNVQLPEELLKGYEIEYRIENDKLLLRIESKATYTDEGKIVFDEVYQSY